MDLNGNQPIPRALSLVPLQDTAERLSRVAPIDPARAAFTAQLLAMRLDAPVARRLRRAAPVDALRCYAAAAALSRPGI